MTTADKASYRTGVSSARTADARCPRPVAKGLVEAAAQREEAAQARR